MIRLLVHNAVSFSGMKHLNTVDISASYGVLRVRAAVVIAAVMAVLVLVGGANACHHNAETAEQPPQRFLRKLTRRLKSKPDQRWSFLAFC